LLSRQPRNPPQREEVSLGGNIYRRGSTLKTPSLFVCKPRWPLLFESDANPLFVAPGHVAVPLEMLRRNTEIK
jgi:hypothetical protein